ncbi:MAG TPA: preprotein translocase subunit SecG [Caldisericia bacterium]|nr:preprotein translocase subunit SecG [Caldisericia bacterium]HOR46489.1 preprotein translocase subunit SecG [Caldisericia bacterium]HOU07913.1 preprotein translocase subunit SecG [Caldisericia bacterium]HPL89280.1 preprotein translocase subunit SecG [Caldisericia bacterium]HQG59954.1 preprotein translocase subunit SecG [Caldisericia bacterium]
MVLFRNIMVTVVIIAGIGMVFGYIVSSPKASGLGAIGGTAQKFKVRKSRDLFLDKLILWSALIFGVCAFVLSIVDPSIWTM